MLTQKQKDFALKYLPHVMQDRNEPFPIRYIGVTFFDSEKPSPTFAHLQIDPADFNARLVVEYAVYMDYDIQHLYELEHFWVAVGGDGTVKDCLCSFHGKCVHATGIPEMYHTESGIPVLYMQPGKHAFMPDPRLFGLHLLKDTCCSEYAGGGLLIPDMLCNRMTTSPEQDAKIRDYIRRHFSFAPAWEFVPVPPIRPEQLVTAEELLELIPQLVNEQLKIIEQDSPAE